MNTLTKTILLFSSFSVVGINGCASMEPAPAPPARPILTCGDCNDLVYFGPQQAPAPDPRVQMASIIAKAVTGVTGIVVGGNVATSIASDLASGVASQTLVSVPSSNNTTIERTSSSKETYISDSVTDRVNNTMNTTTTTQTMTPTTQTMTPTTPDGGTTVGP